MGKWTFGEALPRFFGAIENGLKGIDWGRLNESLSNFWTKLQPFAQTVGDGLLWFWENVLVPFGTWVLNDAVPVLLDLISRALEVLMPIIDAAKEAFKWLWDNFLKPLAEYVADKAIQALKDFAEKLSTIGNWMSEHKWVAELIGTFAAVIGTVAAAIGIFNAVCAIAAPIIGAFSAAIAAINWPIVLITAAIAALIAIVVVLIKHWDEIKEVAKKCWDKIVEAWHAAGDWFKKNVVEPISKFFSGLWDGVKKAFTTAWDFISGAFKGYINGWIRIIEGFINFFVDAINFIIRGINKISFDVPDWVPGIGGGTVGFNIKQIPSVSIPKLATGAVIPPRAEFAAILGDQKHGRNLEAPEGLIREIVREESGTNGALTIVLQMPNGLQETVFNLSAAERRNRRSGKIIVPVGGV